MEKLILIYVGKRLNGKALVHAYTTKVPTKSKSSEYFGSAEDNLMLFSKALLPCSIGNAIEATKQPKGVKGPYNYMRVEVPKEVVTEWSTRSAAAIGTYKLRKESSEKLDGDIELLINAIKKYAPSRRGAAIHALLKLI